MRAHFSLHLPLEDAKTDQLLKFVRRVIPDADPTDVLLFIEIHRASHQLTQAVEKGLADAGLSWAKFRMLLELQRADIEDPHAGLQPSELSARQDIGRNSASALIAGLEAEGLVSRELHSTDRRKFVIRLTPAGRRLLKLKLEGQFQFFTDCFDALDSAKRAALLDLLMRLNASLAEKDKQHRS
jgi:DNA-binding MarR family transcriptional regulator